MMSLAEIYLQHDRGNRKLGENVRLYLLRCSDKDGSHDW